VPAPEGGLNLRLGFSGLKATAPSEYRAGIKSQFKITLAATLEWKTWNQDAFALQAGRPYAFAEWLRAYTQLVRVAS
jgi:hypothetical protein